jgi:hypothetical protein
MGRRRGNRPLWPAIPALDLAYRALAWQSRAVSGGISRHGGCRNRASAGLACVAKLWRRGITSGKKPFYLLQQDRVIAFLLYNSRVNL